MITVTYEVTVQLPDQDVDLLDTFNVEGISKDRIQLRLESVLAYVTTVKRTTVKSTSVRHPATIECNCGSILTDDNNHTIHYEDCAIIQYLFDHGA